MSSGEENEEKTVLHSMHNTLSAFTTASEQDVRTDRQTDRQKTHDFKTKGDSSGVGTIVVVATLCIQVCPARLYWIAYSPNHLTLKIARYIQER